MSVARRVLTNTAVQILGKLMTAALSVMVLKIISGYLGAAGYGDYTTVYQFLALFGIMADFGIYTITVKEMSRDEKRIPEILGNIMGLRTALAVVAMLMAVIIAYVVPSYTQTLIPLGVVIATLATFFTLLNGTITSVLQVHLKMGYATVGLVAGKIVSVGYMAWVAFWLYPRDPILGFYHLLWAGVIGNGVMFALTAYFTRHYTPITYRFDMPFWRKIFWTSLPYGVALALNTVYFRLDTVLMTFLLPHSSSVAVGACAHMLCADTEVGLYGVAQRMLEMLILIPLYFMNSVLPLMSRYAEEKNVKFPQLIQYSFQFLTATGMPLLVGGTLLAVPIIQLISSPEYLSGGTFRYGSDWAVRILMFSMMFSFINSLLGFTLVVLNRQVKLMVVNAIGLGFNLMANLLVLPQFGFRGAALISAVSEALLFILLYQVAHRALKFHLSVKNLFKTILSSMVMGGFLMGGFAWMQNVWFGWQLLTLIPLGMVVYAMMMLKTGAVTPEMIQLIRKTEPSV